jgi:glycosyltransferase involved in cell wall biosynthesis
MTAPLVSVVMPTRDRRLFAQRAIFYFERSEIHRCGGAELIIVDGGKNLLTDAECRGHQRIVVPAGMSIGARCNVGFQHAQGRIFARQDDDDKYGPGWLPLAVDRLPSSAAGLVGAIAYCVYDVFTGRGWRCANFGHAAIAVGGTLVFAREVWERSPFPDRSGGEDVEFAKTAGARFGANGDGVEGSEKEFVYIRQGRNCTGGQAFANIRPNETKEAQAVLGPDLAWYEQLAELVGPLAGSGINSAWHLPQNVQRFVPGVPRG